MEVRTLIWVEVRPLTAVVVMFCTLTFFDAIFAYTRQYGMLYITSKIDARLAELDGCLDQAAAGVLGVAEGDD